MAAQAGPWGARPRERRAAESIGLGGGAALLCPEPRPLNEPGLQAMNEAMA